MGRGKRWWGVSSLDILRAEEARIANEHRESDSGTGGGGGGVASGGSGVASAPIGAGGGGGFGLASVYSNIVFSSNMMTFAIQEASHVEPLPKALVAGPTIGYRLWPVYTDGREEWLGGMVYETQWPQRVPLRGRCEVRGVSEGVPHPQGGACGGTCGIYALKHPNLLEETWVPGAETRFGRLLMLVAGTVALWGKVIEHEHGYRAQWAYPTALWPYRPKETPVNFPKVWLEPLLRVGRAYGVPVFPCQP